MKSWVLLRFSGFFFFNLALWHIERVLLLGAVVSFPLRKGKVVSTAQQSYSFMLSSLLLKLFCVWSWANDGQLWQSGWKTVRRGLRSKVALRPSRKVDALSLSVQPEGVREGAMPHQSWEKLSYIPPETYLISSSREHSNAGLKRRVALDLQVQEAAVGCWESLELTC